MNNEKFIDNGYFMLIESDEFSPPISVVNYQYYRDIKEVQKIISWLFNGYNVTIYLNKIKTLINNL